jgi:hypothetical protein
MKLLRTIRLDPSDAFIFPVAAEPGEWAVPAAFAFYGVDLAALVGEERSAFRSGFLGDGSLAWSTLVQVVDSTPDDRATSIELLAQRLLDPLGAASSGSRAQGRGGRNRLRRLAPQSSGRHPHCGASQRREWCHPRNLPRAAPAPPMRAFSFHENEDGPGETVDRVTLARGDPRCGEPE